MPMTLEAEVIHYADNASAKARSMADALNTAGQFSGVGKREQSGDLGAGPTAGLSRLERLGNRTRPDDGNTKRPRRHGGLVTVSHADYPRPELALPFFSHLPPVGCSADR